MLQDVEKRQSRRFSTNLTLSKQTNPFLSILDISSGGLKLTGRLGEEMRPRQIFHLDFSLTSAFPNIHAAVEIVWVTQDLKKQRIFVGAKFTDISPYHKSALLYYGCQKHHSKYNLSHDFTFHFFNLLKRNSLRSSISDVHQLSIPENLKKQLSPYSDLTIRNEFFFNCCYKAMRETTLQCVDLNLRKEVIETKFHAFLFSVILDDLLDQGKEYALLEAVLKIPFAEQEPNTAQLSPHSKDLFNKLKSLWIHFYKRLQNAPRFKQFHDIFKLDYLQFIQSIHYASILHHMPQMNNLYEAQTLHPHSIHVSIHSTIDLMYSTLFDLTDLPPLRHITLVGQYMSHITNWITSWERELFIDDFTSGVYAYAIDQQLISFEQLLDKSRKQEVVQRIKNSSYREYFFLLLDGCREELERCQKNIKSVDVAQYIKGIENLFLMQITYNL